MPRVNFRAVRERFTHIDASFAGCFLSFDSTCVYRVRLYPWWEHPRYLAAREQGTPWGFTNTEDGAKVISVYPIEPIAFNVSRHHDVTDWDFVESGPHIWAHQPTGQIFINRSVGADALLGELAARLNVSRTDLASVHLDLASYGTTPSFSLRAPADVHTALVETLEARGIDHVVGVTPSPLPLVALVLATEDSIVASDFELDVPEFEHRDAWFTP